MTKDTEALREALKDLARGVFIDAATITHHSWVDGTNGREPDFDEYAGDYAESFADAYVDNITAALATPASDVAPVGDYHVTAAQYEAAVKGRQDFRQAYREQLNLLSQKEWAAVAQIGADQELSTSAVLRQAVRLYQMHLYRLKAGETLSWSGDEQRAKDFAGPLYAHPPHPAPVYPVSKPVAPIHDDDCEAMLRPRADCTCCPTPVDPVAGGEALREVAAKYADMGIDERAEAMADNCDGDPWELIGYFREKLRQSQARVDAANNAATGFAKKLAAQTS